MRMYPREFPASRKKKPKRQAEQRVYEALAGSDRQGFVYYEWRKGYQRIELDFAVWTEGLGRFAVQVKGGRYLLVDGDWHLKTRDGVKPVGSCPLDETKLAALDLHDDIRDRAGAAYNPYVIPVLVFPDMEADPAIAKLACRQGVYVVSGVQNLLEAFSNIVHSRGVSGGLPMERIAGEVDGVTDGMIRLDGFEERASKGPRPTAASPSILTLRVVDRNVLSIRARSIGCRRRGAGFIPTSSLDPTRT